MSVDRIFAHTNTHSSLPPNFGSLDIDRAAELISVYTLQMVEDLLSIQSIFRSVLKDEIYQGPIALDGTELPARSLEGLPRVRCRLA
jgi:hypothetical protein